MIVSLENVFAYAHKACCGGVRFLGPRGIKILLRYVSVPCKAVRLSEIQRRTVLQKGVIYL